MLSYLSLSKDKIVDGQHFVDYAIDVHQCKELFRKIFELMEQEQHYKIMMSIKQYSVWEQRELGEVADIVGGGTPSTSVKEFWDGGIDWYFPVEIGNKVFVNSSQKKITELGFQKSSAQMLPAGTVLFTSRAGIGSTAILEKEACTNQGFQSIVPKDNLDTYFIYSRTHELKRYGEITGAGSTFVEVSGKQMAKMPILVPDIEEQREIGNFFQKLDQTIAFQQRELLL